MASGKDCIHCLMSSDTMSDYEEFGQDNRDIVDDGSAQALNECDILQLRAQASGQVRHYESSTQSSSCCSGGSG